MADILPPTIAAKSPIATIAASQRHSYWRFLWGYGLLAILSSLIERHSAVAGHFAREE